MATNVLWSCFLSTLSRYNDCSQKERERERERKDREERRERRDRGEEREEIEEKRGEESCERTKFFRLIAAIVKATLSCMSWLSTADAISVTP